MQLFQPSKVVYSPYGVSMDRPTVLRIRRIYAHGMHVDASRDALARAILTGYTFRNILVPSRMMLFSQSYAPLHRNSVNPPL